MDIGKSGVSVSTVRRIANVAEYLKIIILQKKKKNPTILQKQGIAFDFFFFFLKIV